MNTYGIAGIEDRQFAAMEAEHEDYLNWLAENDYSEDDKSLEDYREWLDNALLDAQEDAAEARANW